MKITHDGHTIEVSKDSFESMYKRLGYVEVSAVKKVEAPKAEQPKIVETPKAKENTKNK